MKYALIMAVLLALALVGAAHATDPYQLPQNGNTIGSASAPVTIEAYIDTQSPFVKQWWTDTLPQIADNYIATGKAKLVVHMFPLEGQYPGDTHESLMVECGFAESVGYTNLHNIFVNDYTITSSPGCDLGAANQSLATDMHDGTTNSVKGVPEFFINGQKISGAQPYSTFQQTIDAAYTPGGTNSELGVQFCMYTTAGTCPLNDTLFEGQTKTYTLNGAQFDVTVTGIENSQASLRVNGVQGPLLSAGQSGMVGTLGIRVNDVSHDTQTPATICATENTDPQTCVYGTTLSPQQTTTMHLGGRLYDVKYMMQTDAGTIFLINGQYSQPLSVGSSTALDSSYTLRNGAPSTNTGSTGTTPVASFCIRSGSTGCAFTDTLTAGQTHTDPVNGKDYTVLFVGRGTQGAVFSVDGQQGPGIAEGGSWTFAPGLSIIMKSLSTTTAQIGCTDSDGGINYAVKGQAVGYWSPQQPQMVGNDACLTQASSQGSVVSSGPAMVEVYCQAGFLQQAFHNCTNGCSDGACLAAPNGSAGSGTTTSNGQYYIVEFCLKNSAGVCTVTDTLQPTMSKTYTVDNQQTIGVHILSADSIHTGLTANGVSNFNLHQGDEMGIGDNYDIKILSIDTTDIPPPSVGNAIAQFCIGSSDPTSACDVTDTLALHQTKTYTAEGQQFTVTYAAHMTDGDVFQVNGQTGSALQPGGWWSIGANGATSFRLQQVTPMDNGSTNPNPGNTTIVPFPTICIWNTPGTCAVSTMLGPQQTKTLKVVGGTYQVTNLVQSGSNVKLLVNGKVSNVLGPGDSWAIDNAYNIRNGAFTSTTTQNPGCTGYSCLIDAAPQCTPTNANIETTYNLFGVITKVKEIGSIVGKNGSDCVLTLHDVSVESVTYSDALKQSLRDQGYTDTEIAQQESQAAQSALQSMQSQMRCSMPASQLKTMLTAWSNGNSADTTGCTAVAANVTLPSAPSIPSTPSTGSTSGQTGTGTQTGTSGTANSCPGCTSDNLCYPIGTRVKQNGVSEYCGLQKTLEQQKSLNASCENNFECLSNQCSNGQCVDLQQQLQQNQNLLQRILSWLGSIFG